MDIQYGDLWQLNWLWLIPLCAASAVFAVVANRRARRRFTTPNLIGRVLPPSTSRQILVSTFLVSASIAWMVIALVDIRWGKVWRDVPQKGIEVMFVLDVSRSMLAEDTTPNRLSRAKQQITDIIDEMAGDRVGLFVFAGDVRQEIPLTSHYDDFKQSLDAVGPHSVRRGGSRLGDAIDAAAKGFLGKTNDHKAMVILTDGEDQESEPLQAAQKAFEDLGVRIYTIGLGDIKQGARIPIRRDQPGRSTQAEPSHEYLQHDGQQVWSKLDGKILQQIASKTGGAYIPAGTKHVNMADVYHGYIANVPQQEFETARIQQYEARYQWFLAAALALLVAEITWSTRPTRTNVSRGAELNLSAGDQYEPANQSTGVAA